METIVAIAAAVATLVSAVFVWFQVREMQVQTQLQREIAEAASQPYVWADIRISPDNGWTLHFVLGNSGPTVARNVCVRVDPPLPSDGRATEFIERLRPKLERGLSSLSPGQELAWPLGGSPELVNRDASLAHAVLITYDGPHGAVTPTEFVIDLDDVRESAARHLGTMHDIRKAVDRLAKAVEVR